uniref:Uncharacterized protein n=1 Tax=Microviridae sp. ctMIi2 TaxID=2824993 RepID=A0A8S5R2S5_9VIRU|nr:MAG TPA: hypothetical protein [Microviridae sp. ctMIi2]
MKIGEFFKSKRNLTIIGQGLFGTIAALFPEKFTWVSQLVQALFGVN